MCTTNLISVPMSNYDSSEMKKIVMKIILSILSEMKFLVLCATIAEKRYQTNDFD